MSNSIGGSGKTPFRHEDYKKAKDNPNQPKVSEEGEKLKFVKEKLKNRVIEDYKPHKSTPIKASLISRPGPSALGLPEGTLQRTPAKKKINLKTEKEAIQYEKDKEQQRTFIDRMPKIGLDRPADKPVHSNETFSSPKQERFHSPVEKPKFKHEEKVITNKPIVNKNITNKPQMPNMGELAKNPMMMRMRKKADEGTLHTHDKKQAKDEFAKKAEGLGYRFNKEFAMYVPFIDDGSKEALTKTEMKALIQGKPIEHKEHKFEGRTDELDAFAGDAFYEFEDSMGMYVTNNPFSLGEKVITIDDMKEMMKSLNEKTSIDKIAKEQGYKPYPGNEGLYQNEDGDIKAAYEFQ